MTASRKRFISLAMPAACSLRPHLCVSAFSASPPAPDTASSLATSLANAAKSTRKTQRIAVVGAGAVGSYYGGRLWEGWAGSDRDHDHNNVMFHLRNDNYDHCVEHGIDVSSYHGDFFIPPEELSAFRSTEDLARGANGDVDWIVCALKSTSLSDVPKLIEPLLSPSTRLLVIMNGLIEDDLIQMMRDQQQSKGLEGVGCRAIYGGMALICTNRLSPGEISHTYGGKLVCGVAYSEEAGAHDENGWMEADKEAILELFRPVKPVPFEFASNLRRGRWWKNVWNLPFSGISVSMGGITIDRIVNNPSLRTLAYKVIDETIAIANADLIKHKCPEDQLLGEETKNEMMTLSDNMGPYKPSTMLDLHSRKPMEVKYLFRTAVDRADELGIACPHLETIVCHIEAYATQMEQQKDLMY